MNKYFLFAWIEGNALGGALDIVGAYDGLGDAIDSFKLLKNGKYKGFNVKANIAKTDSLIQGKVRLIYTGDEWI